jgi:small-conductance mechanosensitive channel
MTRLIPEKIDNALHGVRSFGLENVAWSIGLVVAAFFAGRIVAWALIRSAKRWAKHTETKADDLVVEHLPGPLRALLPAVGVALVLPVLPARSKALEHALLVLIIASVGWTAFRLLRVVEDYFELRYDLKHARDVTSRARYTQLSGLRNVGGFIIVLVTVAFALMTFDTVRNIGAGLLASAGVAGIVLGFAAQKTIATVFAGVQLAVAQPIRVGDIVVVEGEWGTIEEIALTYVVVRVWDLRRLVLPVNYFIDKPFQNWTRGATNLLGTVELRLDYSVSVDAVREELKRILEASTKWNKETSAVQVTDATERTMLVRVLVSAKNADDLWDLRCAIREKLIAFVQTKFPGALPRLRAETIERRAA